MNTNSRRDFLRNGWKVGGALLGAAAAWTTYEALRPLSSGAGGATVKVGSASDFVEGTATYFPEGRFFVVNAQRHYFAISQKCPHLGCRIPFCETSGRFECPCHGSVFDLAGEYIKGPSPRGMDRFGLAAHGTELVVDTSVVTPGPDRGVHEYLTPAKGPECKGA